MSESENIDLRSNFCVPEDAFDQFQAKLMYEEEEFITLSDIVEPPQPTLNLPACLDEMQDDICVVIQSDLPRNDDTVVAGQELLNPVDIQTRSSTESKSVTEHSKREVEDSSESLLQPVPKKRGKRRKSTLPSLEMREQYNVINESLTSDCREQSSSTENGDAGTITIPDKIVLDRLNQSESDDFNTSTNQTSTKRQKQLHNVINSPNMTTDNTLKPRKKGRPKKKVNTPTAKQPQSRISQEVPPKAQRGRPKKVVTSNKKQVQSHNDEDITFEKPTDDIFIPTSHEEDKSNLLQHSATSDHHTEQSADIKVPHKHGRPKKSNIDKVTNTSLISSSSGSSTSNPERRKSKNKTEDKKYDDIELELLRILLSPTKDLEEESEEEMMENKQKNSKKRGRKTKNLVDKAESSFVKPEDNEAEKTICSNETDDEGDDICLSSLKKRLKSEDDKREDENVLLVIDNTSTANNISENIDSTPEISIKRNSKKPIMSDFEYNVDSIENECIGESAILGNSAETIDINLESPSKRPTRRKAKKVLHYDEGSDEDPFANVELSDDDGDLSRRRGGRYYSDDEYVPGVRKKGRAYSVSESSMSGSDVTENNDDTVKVLGRKKGKRSEKSLTKSYKHSKKNHLKKNSIPDVTSTAADTTTQIDDDLKQSVHSPDITHEFENFIAQKIQGTDLKIKKLTGTQSNESAITPLEIPVLDPSEPKKTVEIATQTNKTSRKNVEIQTTSPYEGVMKYKVPLTTEQSEKACDFLKGIVKNTSELGQLMIQKSEDFINKKINTKNVTDTNKMDYCVQKSFLLFKLAKHNLIQMEEDLASEYEHFLKTQNMSQYLEKPKCITANAQQIDSDSDCEIVEEPIPDKEKKNEKSKFNLKTVFLNKELSIKIAKKSTEEPQEKKGKRHIKSVKNTVWINDSIMVKKVKPTQSFLAQDSRNKKPPDTFVTIKMVRDFFDKYYKRQQVLLTCAPFVSTKWLSVNQIGICNYFIAHSNALPTHSRIIDTPQNVPNSNNGLNSDTIHNCIEQPISLLKLCTRALHIYMYKTKAKKHCQSLLEHYYQPNTLFQISFNVISSMLVTEHSELLKSLKKSQNIKSLKKLCLRSINTFIHNPRIDSAISHGDTPLCFVGDMTKTQNHRILNESQQIKRDIKTLFSFCVEALQKTGLSVQKCDSVDLSENNKICNNVKSLKCIALEKVKRYLDIDCLHINQKESITDAVKEVMELTLDTQDCVESTFNKVDHLLTLTIKCVNALSDDIFAKLSNPIVEEPSCLEDDSFSNHDEYESGYTECNEYTNLPEESNWVARVQLQELKSCFMPIDDNPNVPELKDTHEEGPLVSIKIEPAEETFENLYGSAIKTEAAEIDEMNFNPLATKLENPDNEPEDIIIEQTSSSYDVDEFEAFASTNKMLQSTLDYNLVNDEIFSQSALRIRKQHEPDVEDEFDTDMSLLIPQEHNELVKDRLMKSSSDEETKRQKSVIKKKRKIRLKIPRHKNKDMTVKNKNAHEKDVAMLTRTMQERIRQEENTDDSSDSEFEKSLFELTNDKSKQDSHEKAKLETNGTDDQIQCNDVDSTENLIDKSIRSENKNNLSQQKCPKILLRKEKVNSLEHNNNSEQDNSTVIKDAPIEPLECEPTVSMKPKNTKNIETDDIRSGDRSLQIEPPCTERHGWKCYPVNNDDTKLYEYTYVLLEKLPESFVDTYFRYKSIAKIDQDDSYIERLVNLQSLHRNFNKDNKGRSKANTISPTGQLKSKNKECDSRSNSAGEDDYRDEFTPSEDEEVNLEHETAPAPLKDTSDNVMAKNSLMTEVDSDSEKQLKPEAEAILTDKKIKDEQVEKEEPGNKRCKTDVRSENALKENDSTFLTADKMMNKELTMLHAPVKLDAEDAKNNEESKKTSPQLRNRTSLKLRLPIERINSENESSSEEEKQWVTTKEKLLKRLGKKQGNSSVDDAKRAKIVSEFIEKHGDAHDKRPINRIRKPRSRKKFLERKKQMSVLNKELFGEDTSHASKKHSQTFGKGRRNIRKVIDKKSLARNTVIANMEEFERKRRLSMQQTRLREQLGCEEGVNVLVINDEVCLEYDFKEMRPVVTVHSFFTKVMKAHQYEGVKFMWDACFESLAMVSAGNPGGGCILAHCMGLGKTLQVLALLHTVLTHPGVGMKRVLVCCPLSTVLNWVDEINKWIGPVTNQIKVFELSKLKKTYERAYQLEDWYKDGGIFIIGYELFRSLTTLDSVLDDIKPKIVNKIRHALLNPGPDMVICDEGHLLKNDASVLAVAMSRVATRRRIVLTGTPMQNNLREYYCMVNFVKPNLLGTYAEYSNRFENPIMNGQHRDSQEEDIKLMKARTHILHKVLEGCLQRQEASVLYPYLPKKFEYTVFIPPTKCQWDLYKHYIMTYAMEQQQQNKPQKQNLLKDFHVLQKIWTHPQVLHNFLMKARDERIKLKEEKVEDDLAQEDLAASEDVKPNQTEVWWLQYLAGGDMLESLESSNKFVVVFQLLEEFITLGDKVLIFSTSLYTMDALEYFLKRINKWSLGQDYFRLDGSVPAEVRQKWCREFNAPTNINTKLFLISTRAGSLGLNMTAANRVIILDTSWNPAHDIQSIFRVYRFGQKKDCYIYRLVAMGTMEQKIYERSVTKQAVSCRVVDEQQIDRHYNMAELTELYRYDEEGATVEAGLAAGVSDVALLRVASRARLHAVREHDSLLRGSREQHLPEHERNAAWMQFQEEHANNEMQDRLMEASQGIKRMVEANYANSYGSISVKTEEQPQETGPKGKKSKKKAASSPPTPAEDPKLNEQNDVLLEAAKEEAKVKIIMQLLIKHNFHTSKRAKEITELVANVRSIVDAGGSGLEHCDELTRSIATVMLQEEDKPSPTTPPPLIDIVTGDVIKPDSIGYETNRTEQNLVMQSNELSQLSMLTQKEIKVETREEITDKPHLNIDPDSSDEGTLPTLGSMQRSMRTRKYLPDEISEPASKRARVQSRKNTTDTEHSSVEEEIVLRDDTLKSTLGGKKSMQLTSRLRRSYTSDLDSSDDHCSSKKQLPNICNKTIAPSRHRSHVSHIDDEDNRSSENEPVVDPDVRKKSVHPEIKKTRAVAVKSTAKLSNNKINANSKTKRKAAMVAEQHLEKFEMEHVVTLDDDDDEWVEESDTSSNRQTRKLRTPSRGTDNQKDKNKTLPVGKKNVAKSDGASKYQKQSSILLSDDEDRAVINKPEEEVPLHPSMLSNANFIKIVAYAYQSNRMLDEDAALLAARYSTQKALKEYEATGKGITSGPLYDIAVKMLTKDVLKKLNSKKDSKKNELFRSNINKNVKNYNSTSNNSSTPKASSICDVTIVEENKPPNYEPVPSEITSQAKIVPVGMFKGSSVDQKRHEVIEECILPDDDDCILGTTREISQENIYKKPNAQPFVITSVKSHGRQRTQSSAMEIIIPEIECLPSHSQNNSTKSFGKVEPIITITEKPKHVGLNAPTYRTPKMNLQNEPAHPELEPTKKKPSQSYLTLTISEGKIIQPYLGVIKSTSNNVSSFSKTTPSYSKQVPLTAKRVQTKSGSQSLNDTICLDSDEEIEVNDEVVKILPAPAKAVVPRKPFPSNVAKTTGKPSFSATSAQTQSTSAISAESHTKKNDKIQQKRTILISPPTALDNLHQQKRAANKTDSSPLPTKPLMSSKPSSSAKSDVAQTKMIIYPDNVLNGAQKDKQMPKLCKPGDIVRITKQGTIAVLSKVDKVPDNVKLQMLKERKINDAKFQPVIEKDKPSISNATAQSGNPGKDPLSILKDVIHIQADEYDSPASKTQPEKDNKSCFQKEAGKQTSKGQSKDAEGNVTFEYEIKLVPDAPKATKDHSESVVRAKNEKISKNVKVQKELSECSAATIDLTNIVPYKKSKTVASTGSIIVGSSKDIIIRTKPLGSVLTKASTSSNNLHLKIPSNHQNDKKKRTAPWVDLNSPKKKKTGILRPKTLEDFDIDDIDDIIELE